MKTEIAKRRQVLCQAGDWFSIPLRPGGFGLGLIARGGENSVLFGYFFGPKREHLPTLDEAKSLKPREAVLLARFGDLGLQNGRWHLIGRLLSWNMREWPMPSFVRRDIVSGKLSLVTYDEKNPSLEVKVERATPEECKWLPADGLSGYGAIEIKLTRFLERSLVRDPRIIN